MKWLKRFLLKLLIKYVLDYAKEGKMLAKIKEFLTGRKTYLVGIAAIIGVLIAYANGTMEAMEAIKAIVEAILAMTIRAGVATAAEK